MNDLDLGSVGGTAFLGFGEGGGGPLTSSRGGGVQLGVGQELRGGLMAGPPLCREMLMSSHSPPILQPPPPSNGCQTHRPRSCTQAGTPRTPPQIARDINPHQEPKPTLPPPSPCTAKWRPPKSNTDTPPPPIETPPQ